MQDLLISTSAAAGEDGSATATATSQFITGFIYGLHIVLTKGTAEEVADTTTLRVESESLEVLGDGSGGGIDVVATAGATVTVNYFPRLTVNATDGTAGSAEEMIPVYGEKVTITVGAANAGQLATVKLLYL